MNVMEYVRQGVFYLDGGTGTSLQKKGLRPGELPETWNLTRPADIIELHRAYYEAGSHAVCTNTFGANGLKFDGKNGNPSIREIVHAAVSCAKAAREAAGGCRQKDLFIALDLGPLGHLLSPLGDLLFETAVSLFAEVVRAGVEAGADFVLIETMHDCYETKAAVLAAKENSDLPIFVSNVYDEHAKMLSATTPEAMVALLEGLGVDVIGINCSLGPAQMLNLMPRFTSCASVPLLIKPNAGLPRGENGEAAYDVSAEDFAVIMKKAVAAGAGVVGGCCGTTPAYIKALVRATQGAKAVPSTRPSLSVVSSSTHAVQFGALPIIIGEKINPTGRNDFKEALRQGDLSPLVQEGVRQAQSGAHILDVNVGLPDLDEPSVLEKCVQELQRVCSLPLQLDTSNPLAMERAMRVYNGKPMINSVSGDPRSMDAIFPLVRKFGGLTVCLTLDEKGIPGTARGRLKIAEKILRRAEEFGIKSCDLIFDPLALTISSDSNSAVIALETVALIHEHLRALCCLGVSNISFGLPDREQLNADFLLMALANGLDAAIVNPCSAETQRAYASYKALAGADENCRGYIREAKNRLSIADKHGKESLSVESADTGDLRTAILDGLCSKAAKLAARALERYEPLALIDEQIIPALDAVGKAFESGETFLPQLLMSADAAKAALTEIKKRMPAAKEAGPAVILATVKGDIHDIGKNIAKAMLENYGYQIIDLGRDVPPGDIADEAVRLDVRLVGLSALMTTTAPAMAQTIQLLREKKPDCRIVVAGAVITQDYADQIGADHYAQNAMETVRYAAQVFKDVKGKI